MVESKQKQKQKYEDIRRKRVEENKKRMEELSLKKLSENLSPQRTPNNKQVKPRTSRQAVQLIPVRRSSRVASKPQVSYKEVPGEPLERPRRGYSYRHRDLLNRVYASSEARAYAIDRAEQIQSGLENDFPSFVKPMLQSHVTGGFWLGLPGQFCKEHLPHRDEYITLEDEKGEEFATKYLAEKTGLSGGWRGFAIDHELVDGDCLVFQLVTPIKFKVYIVRAYGSEEGEDNDYGEDNDGDQDKENNEENGKDSDIRDLYRSSKRARKSRK